jgi:uncharacterized protein YcbX
MPDTSQSIGTVRLIHRFPVKGMAGEEIPEVFVTYAGLTGDRVYAFVDPENKTDFPWMTSRLWPGMLLLKPRFLAPPRADEELPAKESYRVEVTTPDGSSHDVSAETFRKFLEEKFGRPIVLRFSERCMQDTRPISVFGAKSLAALSAEAGVADDPRRFRPNLLVDWNVDEPYFEDSLINRRLRIGEKLLLEIVKRDQRCKVITLDPDTAQASPQVLEIVARQHQSCVGVYAAVLRAGIVRRGDPIFVD